MKILGNYTGVGIETNSEKKASHKFKIGNASKIIKMLRDKLYSNPVQTMVQEYLANGRDAHREALKTNPQAMTTPMQVTLPTHHESVLKIRDFGVGISPERMGDVFIQYGNTTKAEDEEQNGGFGIGAKIAFAYTDSFSIITFLNGVRRTYLAHIGENSDGTLEELSEEKTSEANGTEIQIPIKPQDIERIRKSYYRATLFWDVQPETKGVIPEEIPSFYKTVSEVVAYSGTNWKLYSGGELAQFLENVNNNHYSNSGIYLIVDGIPYPLSSGFFDLASVRTLREYISRKLTLTIHLRNKDVEVNPNREQLVQSDFSKRNIEKFCLEIAQELEAKIQAQIDKSTDLNDYIQNHQKINTTLENRMETSFTSKDRVYKLDGNGILSCDLFKSALIEKYVLSKLNNGKKIVNREHTNRIYVKDGFKFLINDTTDGAGKTRERIRNHFNGETGIPLYILTPHPEGNPEDYKKLLIDLEVDTLSSLPLPVVEKTKIARASNKGKICIYFLEHDDVTRYRNTQLRKTPQHLLPSQINDKQKYLYLEMDQGSLPNVLPSSKLATLSKFLTPRGYQIVALSPLSKSKLEELKFTNFFKLESFMQNFTTNFPLTEEEKLSLVKSSWSGMGKFYRLFHLKDKIKDKDLVELIEFHEGITSLPDRLEIPSDILSLYEKEKIEAERSLTKQKELLGSLNKKYPLFSEINFYSNNSDVVWTELLEYINLKHKNLKNKS